MKITREADYAFRIIMVLSKEKFHIEAKQISEQKLIPYRFTLKILRKLVKAGVVKSYRGVNGGYALNKAPAEITLREIIEIIDGPLEINRCLGDESICPNAATCAVRKSLISVQKHFVDDLETVTFETLTT